jgi:hypothetical protein
VGYVRGLSLLVGLKSVKLRSSELWFGASVNPLVTVTVCVFVILDLYFDSVKCMLVSVKLLCVCVKFLKILSKKGIFVIMEKSGLFLSNVI